MDDRKVIFGTVEAAEGTVMTTYKDCPDNVMAALETIRSAWNAVRDDDSPFGNTGTRFFGQHCTIIAYDWSDEPAYDFNFRWRDFTAEWYKCLGRGTRMSRDLSREEIIAMVNECCADILDN